MGIDESIRAITERIKGQYREMLKDCDGEESQGWYSWIEFKDVMKLLAAIDKAAQQPKEKPLHHITANGCSICGTDALHCKFWDSYRTEQPKVSNSTGLESGDGQPVERTSITEHPQWPLVAKEQWEAEQVLGKALGYPWYKADKKNFPDATEADGVCTGEHTLVTIAMEAASRLEREASSPPEAPPGWKWVLAPEVWVNSVNETEEQ